MYFYPVRYLPTGHIFIDPDDDCDRIVDVMLATNYNEEFCLARDFDVDFIRRLMEAGFLVMSMELRDDEEDSEDDRDNGENNGNGGNDGDGDGTDSGDAEDDADKGVDAEHTNEKFDTENREPFYILLPKLHLSRSALFFPELHIKKSIRPHLSRYELRFNSDFDLILDKCIETHGADWLTPPLATALKDIHSNPGPNGPWAVSFGVYREGRLRAGEIGVAMGRVYTSYSGYFEESNSGTAQMILTAQWLEKTGFDFLDLGMPLDYKTLLGAQNIEPARFVELFRAGRY